MPLCEQGGGRGRKLWPGNNARAGGLGFRTEEVLELPAPLADDVRPQGAEELRFGESVALGEASFDAAFVAESLCDSEPWGAALRAAAAEVGKVHIQGDARRDWMSAAAPSR